MDNIESAVATIGLNGLPRTIADRTRRVYDRMSVVYPLSTYFFHSRAHKCALEAAGVRDGMRVLEVATGSGEMFRRLVRVNRSGETYGFDLSPKMARRTHERIHSEFPQAKALCQAVDARYLPFPGETFDIVFCCYLLELLATEDIVRALGEMRRVLRTRGKLALVCIGQNAGMFNKAYKVAASIVPAFWGRQVAHHVPSLMDAARLSVIRDQPVKQGFYPSRVIVASK